VLLVILPLATGMGMGMAFMLFFFMGIPGLFYSNNLDKAEGLRGTGILVLGLVLGVVPMILPLARCGTPILYNITIFVLPIMLPIMLYIYGAWKNLKNQKEETGTM